MRLRIFLTLTILTAPAAASMAAELTPAEEPKPDIWPYSPAKLTLTNTSDVPVEQISLRWLHGGPTLVWAVELAPGQEKVIDIFLPAAWPDQEYEVALLGADGRAAASYEATINWPDELVRSDAFIDTHTWGRWNPSPAEWDHASRGNAFIAVALVCVAASGTLLVGRSRLRVLSSAVAVVAGTAIVAVLLPNATDTWSPPADVASGRVEGPPRELLATAARRTAVGKLDDEILAPVYLSRGDMAQDTMVLNVSTGRAEVPMRAGRLRLFRRIDPP